MRRWKRSILCALWLLWGAQALASTQLHATIVNKLMVSNQDDQDVGAIVFDFKGHESMTVDVDDFMASHAGESLSPKRGLVHVKRKRGRKAWVVVALPKTCLRTIDAGYILRVYGEVDAGHVRSIHCTLNKVPVSDVS